MGETQLSEFGRVLKANFSPSPLGVLSVRYFPSCRPYSILVQYWRYVLFARYESASIDVVVCRTLFLFLSASSFFFFVCPPLLWHHGLSSSLLSPVP